MKLTANKQSKIYVVSKQNKEYNNNNYIFNYK